MHRLQATLSQDFLQPWFWDECKQVYPTAPAESLPPPSEWQAKYAAPRELAKLSLGMVGNGTPALRVQLQQTNCNRKFVALGHYNIKELASIVSYEVGTSWG